MREALSRVPYVVATMAIATVLVCQFVASFGGTDRYFPFMWYPMYSTDRSEGDRLVVRHTLYAVTADGGRHAIHPDHDLKIGFWRFERGIVRAMKVGSLEPLAPQLPAIVKRYPTLTALELEDYPAILTRDGPRPAPHMVLARFDADAIRKELP